MKGHRISYSTAELDWLEANRTLSIRDCHRRFCDLFDRHDVTAPNLNALRKRQGWRTGRTGRFRPGDAPVNKGVPCAPDRGGNHPNARKTQFKHGHRSGVALARYQPIGAERLSKDGYRERKVHDGLPMQSRWRAVHRIAWEAVHGPVPAGFALKCLGDKRNTDPSNWKLVPRALLPRLNGRSGRGYDAAPAELKPTIMAVAELEQAVHARRAAADSER